ncbi:putative mediator of RNA polymerase II transcription subunit 26 [Scylla paramamosain]|uniref:putative mediator of RNA polymerase II transcription subunit 26 n=1 Tax=Scylla paramamosain TaxID=85552 RepID=UPI003082D3D7
MKPRQRGHSSSAESSYDRSPPSLREDNSEGMPPAHVFTALLQMQSAAMSHGMLPSALKDTEALLSAVHQSQMLYYSYCSQLIHTLKAKQIEQQTQQPQQHHHRHHDHQLNHYPLARQQQQHQHQLHQHHRRFHQQKQPRHHHERTPEQPRLSSESDSERRTPLEEARNYESEDTEEDFHTTEDDTLSILRTRLNSQEAQQLCLEQMSPSAESPSGTLPSSTTGGEDMDQSQMEASGGTRKRAPRALTGKHVRPGTGASASTLITLRQKLQERQKYREVYGVDPPQPTKTTKGRAKKR